MPDKKAADPPLTFDRLVGLAAAVSLTDFSRHPNELA